MVVNKSEVLLLVLLHAGATAQFCNYRHVSLPAAASNFVFVGTVCLFVSHEQVPLGEWLSVVEISGSVTGITREKKACGN